METRTALDIYTQGNLGIVCFGGTDISDMERITAASDQLKEYIKTHRPTRLIFDFAGITFFSSQVLGLLLDAWARLGTRKGQILIAALSPQLKQVFHVTNLDKVFRFYPDRTAALAHSAASSN
jgi:anti-anti-sigma factor